MSETSPTPAFEFPPRSPLKLAVLISGGGTTLRNLLAKIAAGELDARINLVVSSNPKARGLDYGREAGIRTAVLEQKKFASPDAYSQAVFDACRASQCDIVVMAGFLKFVTIPADFDYRVVNIHPGLIPAFCGLGFYGHHVHQAVLDYGAKLSGCTVHFVDNQYDHGPILLQRAVPVLDGDSADALAARVFEAECEAFPEALRLIGAGRVSIAGRKVTIRPSA